MVDEDADADEGTDVDVEEAEGKEVDLGADDAWEDGVDCTPVEETETNEDVGMACEDGKVDEASGFGVVEVSRVTGWVTDVDGDAERLVKELEFSEIAVAGDESEDGEKDKDCEEADDDEEADNNDP